MKRACVVFLLLLTVAVPAQSPPAAIAVHVRESGGIRRNQFPVSARVPFPRGALKDPSAVKLVSNQTDVPAQPSAEVRWPDGSVQWLSLDFNISIGPNESQTYSLQYGNGVKSEAAARGLTLAEDADAIQIGNMRFSRSGSPLVASVKYREEVIAAGPNGVSVADASGTARDIAAAENVRVEILKRGPLLAMLKYSGAWRLGGSAMAPFVVTVEMPNSKSWFKVKASVDDPSKSIRSLAIQLPLTFGALPWVWDFGTSRWTYGSIRTATDSVIMSDTISANGAAQWTVSSGSKGREVAAETSQPNEPGFAGWGHIQGTKEVMAYAIEGVKTRVGTYRIAFDGGGQTQFQFVPPAPATAHELAVYAHFVSTPVQIGAATSPAAILSPLAATCDRAQYLQSGVPVPREVR